MNSEQIDMLNQAYALDRIRDRFEALDSQHILM